MPHQQEVLLTDPKGLQPRPPPKMRHHSSTTNMAASLNQAVLTRMVLSNLASIRKLTQGTAQCGLEVV